ncbi:hypothetical protein EJ04DRAFT_431119 [Polyplosphaeria fusca]|uniref:Uncharacterized protein n=1 Tax=Polyplosphaeria fusca TaxID=682080 RepID=A0A9P4V2C3_9PLEO|nr:hypothetical protein EJ04DRAFT_431119 [Polyplosphaeria fusca]
MSGFTKARPEAEEATPLDLIFSCCVCQATFSEIYEGTKESVHGLSDGINSKERLVTKMYLANCCHVICSKHIDGGGPPFHRNGSQPRAPCPLCMKEKGDKKDKDLFSIRGFKSGEFDPGIPSCWFSTPPVKLDASGPEMEAMRFQFVSLLRFAKQIHSDHRRTKFQLDETRGQLHHLHQRNSEEQNRRGSLEQEIERLRSVEDEMQKLKAKLPAIQHYLKLLPKLTEQNGKMRDRLATLGFALPLEPVAYDKQPYPFDGDGNVILDCDATNNEALKRATSSYTAGRSAETTANLGQIVSSSPNARPRKRLRQVSGHDEQIIYALEPSNRGSSREQMPPPPKPMSRIKSIKKIWPSIRNRVANGRSSPALTGETLMTDAPGCDNGQWHDVGQPVAFTSGADRPQTREETMQDASPYMTGALPAGHPVPTDDSPEPQSIDSRARRSDTSSGYRPSNLPTKNQQAGLPNQPSYIRLFDGLSRNTGFDLELDNFGQEAASECHAAAGLGAKTDKKQSNGYERQHLPGSRRGATANEHQNLFHSIPQTAHMHDGSRATVVNPVTLAPQRPRQPKQRVESVVSPFFRSSQHYGKVASKAGVNQRDHSSPASDVYQYQRPTRARAKTDWREPRSINGLSFFDSPRNTRNAPIEYEPAYTQHSPAAHFTTSQTRNINSQGFMIRPDTGRYPWRGDSAYGSAFSHPYARQASERTHSAIPFPLAPPRASYSQAAPLPSAISSIVSSNRFTRPPSRINLDSLSHAGVRSSRPSHGYIAGNGSATPARNMYSSAGRRTVRR